MYYTFFEFQPDNRMPGFDAGQMHSLPCRMLRSAMRSESELPRALAALTETFPKVFPDCSRRLGVLTFGTNFLQFPLQSLRVYFLKKLLFLLLQNVAFISHGPNHF